MTTIDLNDHIGAIIECVVSGIEGTDEIPEYIFNIQLVLKGGDDLSINDRFKLTRDTLEGRVDLSVGELCQVTVLDNNKFRIDEA